MDSFVPNSEQFQFAYTLNANQHFSIFYFKAHLHTHPPISSYQKKNLSQVIDVSIYRERDCVAFCTLHISANRLKSPLKVEIYKFKYEFIFFFLVRFCCFRCMRSHKTKNAIFENWKIYAKREDVCEWGEWSSRSVQFRCCTIKNRIFLVSLDWLCLVVFVCVCVCLHYVILTLNGMNSPRYSSFNGRLRK